MISLNSSNVWCMPSIVNHFKHISQLTGKKVEKWIHQVLLYCLPLACDMVCFHIIELYKPLDYRLQISVSAEKLSADSCPVEI